MTTLKMSFTIAFVFLLNGLLHAQELTGTLRGQVVDIASESPVPFATVALLNTSPMIGTTSDINGEFEIKDIPIGRYDIQVTFVGYESSILSGVEVISGKVKMVDTRIKESVTALDEIVIKPTEEKEQALNELAVVSARQLSVEEANRFAGGFDDPARLASSYAGVASDLTSNGIVIRGNAPKGLLWRMEGVEVPNPNHFGEIAGFGAGGITALSSQMLANSDFITGAFPAEYGNGLSGVFDLSMRSGNSQEREHTIQVGTLGIDVASEGPFKKGKRGTYLFNYRYSTLGLIAVILPDDAGSIRYQDLAYKIKLPTHKAGTFSFWGLGLQDGQDVTPDKDTTKWEYSWAGYGERTRIYSGVAGATHQYFFGTNTYIKTIFTGSASDLIFDNSFLNEQLRPVEDGKIRYLTYDFTLSTLVNHKFGAKHTNRTGASVRQLNYDILLAQALSRGEALAPVTDEEGNSYLMQAFSQSSFSLGEKVTLNPGLHFQYFALGGQWSLEPRVSTQWRFAEKQTLSFGYGLHSQMEKLSFYFTKVPTPNGYSEPNRDMDFAKSHHFVLGYDLMLGPNTHLKIEPYYQYLYDVPVIDDSMFSFLNVEYNWVVKDTLQNTGLGKNIGVDVTLERFLNNGWYYLLTASVFDSKYTGGDGVWRNTKYNRNVLANVLIGKEWQVGKNRHNVISASGKYIFMGGDRRHPIDEPASYDEKEIIEDYSRAYEDRGQQRSLLHISLGYRINKVKYSSLWSIQVLNTLASKEMYGYGYNLRNNTIDPIADAVVIPSISYKVQF